MIYMIYGDNEDMEMRMLYNDAWQGCGAIVNDGKKIIIYNPITPTNNPNLENKSISLTDFI